MHKDATLCAGRTVAQAQQASSMPVNQAGDVANQAGDVANQAGDVANQAGDVASDQLLVFIRA